MKRIGVRNPEWSRRAARAALVLIQVPLVMDSPVSTALGGIGTPAPRLLWAPLLIGPAVLALLLWLSMQPPGRQRSRAGLLAAALIALLAFVPTAWFPFPTWAGVIVAPMAAALLVLQGRWRAIAVAAMATPILVSYAAALAAPPTPRSPTVAYVLLSGLPGFAISVIAVSGAAWLVRSLDELHATRAELADLAIRRERLRLSRDLHDLLGQSLSAVSLKADLAAYLVRDGDAPGARVHASEFTVVARDALAGLGEVTGGADVVSLREELAGAAALLRAAEIDARVATDANLELPPLIDAALAWSVREGVTNVLRHSAARSADITVDLPSTGVRLEIVNDGVVGGRADGGTGLHGLTSRIGELAGSVSAERVDGDRFRLRVNIPLPTMTRIIARG
jgi:two-component system sensor histidine kinase DesK